ncbi:SsgA family sporulation/cell division regulator [Amycolatopsis sp.]|uniref:SsgA family sporulation/cell division regulator n=1 Tax=Amycolatopsis sp. TaxID=37632 RepID=UPI002B97F0F2|nr:SsgA family sporulation/cell division regulator [Amycolatopsis sp.]HVV10551.1 SsgA family sporulation/cell division regulator [Amycolatopsis sp.]
MRRRSVNRLVSAQIEQDRAGDLVLVPVRVFLRYDVTDPFAVVLDFTTAAGLVTWHLSRDLLIEGLEYGVGDGDVYVAPDSELADRVWVVLTAPTGTAHLAFVRPELVAVLAETRRLVPQGSESGLIDWNRELALLGGAA